MMSVKLNSGASLVLQGAQVYEVERQVATVSRGGYTVSRCPHGVVRWAMSPRSLGLIGDVLLERGEEK